METTRETFEAALKYFGRNRMDEGVCVLVGELYRFHCGEYATVRDLAATGTLDSVQIAEYIDDHTGSLSARELLGLVWLAGYLDGDEDGGAARYGDWD